MKIEERETVFEFGLQRIKNGDRVRARRRIRGSLSVFLLKEEKFFFY
jgi:hypothetical protein